MARRQPTPDELDLTIPHIDYEVVMFHGAFRKFRELDTAAVRRLPRDAPDRIARTMFFEGVLLHARALDDFLRQPATEGRDDDVWATHYLPTWAPVGPLEGLTSQPDKVAIRTLINKQLAHITSARAQQQKLFLPDVHDAVITSMKKFVTAALAVHPNLTPVSDRLSAIPPRP